MEVAPVPAVAEDGANLPVVREAKLVVSVVKLRADGIKVLQLAHQPPAVVQRPDKQPLGEK